MLRHLDFTSLLTAGITSEINKRRTVLGLNSFETVTVDTDLRAGVAGNAAQATFDKHSSLRDVRALVGWLADTAAVTTAVDQLNEALGELADDPTILASLRQRDFVKTGLQLVSDAVCPLCDKDWDDTDWYVQSLSDHDTHRGYLRRGRVQAICGIEFTPVQAGLRSLALAGSPPDPEQICRECQSASQQAP